MSKVVRSAVAMPNPWGRQEISPAQAVLLALAMDPQTLDALAAKAGLATADTAAALETLADDGLAISEDGGYELSGPLSWFGQFEPALRWFARKNFIAVAAADPSSHLYLIDVRVKRNRPVGDPHTETLSVFACGKTAPGGQASTTQGGPTCEDCRRARDLYGRPPKA